MDQHKLGEILRGLRMRRRMTQRELAIRLHVTRQAVSGWERGVSAPDLETLGKIAALCGTDLPGLLGPEGERAARPHRRSSALLYLASLMLAGVLFGLFFSGALPPGSPSVIPAAVGVLLPTVIYFAFGYSLHSGDFSLIAGYDPAGDYDVTVFKKILCGIELFVMADTFFFLLLYLLAVLTQNAIAVPVLTVVYILNFIAGVFVVNYKYKDRLYKGKKPEGSYAASVFPLLVFLVSVAALIGVVIFSMTRFGIKNNTGPAVAMVFLILPYVGVNIAWMVSKLAKKNPPVKIILTGGDFALLLMDIALLLGIFFTARAGSVL